MSTSYQAHARIAKKIINHDAYGVPLLCMWDDCQRPGLEMYRINECRHPVGWSCRDANRRALAYGDPGAHIWMAFCSERHLMFFRHSGGWRALAMIADTGRAYGNLPRGSKGLGL